MGGDPAAPKELLASPPDSDVQNIASDAKNASPADVGSFPRLKHELRAVDLSAARRGCSGGNAQGLFVRFLKRAA